MAHIDPVDPAVWEAPAMRRALAARDITSVYRLLRDAGVSQRQLAALVGQSQSEVSEILAGRQVKQYDTLVRIADGLGVERGRMGLAYTTPYTEGDARTPDEQEVTDPVQRRDLFAVGALATLGFVPSFAALLDDSAAPAEVPLPSRIGASDVAEVRARTEQLRADARREGGQARAASAAAAHYRRLTKVAATDPVRLSLRIALAELDELAGWCCFDSGLDRRARWHYRTAIDLAHQAGDGYRVASALRFAGVVDSGQDSPDDAVKLYQLAGVQLGGKGDPDLSAWLHAVTAGALATMGHEQASDELARARDGWSATEGGWRADQRSAPVGSRSGAARSAGTSLGCSARQHLR